jgi:pantothenate kinase
MIDVQIKIDVNLKQFHSIYFDRFLKSKQKKIKKNNQIDFLL